MGAPTHPARTALPSTSCVASQPGSPPASQPRPPARPPALPLAPAYPPPLPARRPPARPPALPLQLLRQPGHLRCRRGARQGGGPGGQGGSGVAGPAVARAGGGRGRGRCWLRLWAHTAVTPSCAIECAALQSPLPCPLGCRLLSKQEAEELIHLWCVLPRHDAIYTELLDKVDKGLPPPSPATWFSPPPSVPLSPNQYPSSGIRCCSLWQVPLLRPSPPAPARHAPRPVCRCGTMAPGWCPNRG